NGIVGTEQAAKSENDAMSCFRLAEGSKTLSRSRQRSGYSTIKRSGIIPCPPTEQDACQSLPAFEGEDVFIDMLATLRPMPGVKECGGVLFQTPAEEQLLFVHFRASNCQIGRASCRERV